MASTFKNAGISVPVVDTSAGNLFTAGASATAVIHALYISNKTGLPKKSIYNRIVELKS